MLGALCSSDLYNLFKDRFEQIMKLGIFPPGYIIPDWFAERLSDAMDLFHDKDLTVLHKLVNFCLSSSIQVFLLYGYFCYDVCMYISLLFF